MAEIQPLLLGPELICGPVGDVKSTIAGARAEDVTEPALLLAWTRKEYEDPSESDEGVSGQLYELPAGAKSHKSIQVKEPDFRA